MTWGSTWRMCVEHRPVRDHCSKTPLSRVDDGRGLRRNPRVPLPRCTRTFASGHRCQGIHTHVVTFVLQTLGEQAVPILDRLLQSQSRAMADAVNHFPEHLRFGVPTLARAVGFAGVRADHSGFVINDVVVRSGTGRGGPLVPVANARMLAERMPNATLEIIEGAGHSFLWDDAENLGQRIGRFLNRRPGRPGKPRGLSSLRKTQATQLTQATYRRLASDGGGARLI